MIFFTSDQLKDTLMLRSVKADDVHDPLHKV